MYPRSQYLHKQKAEQQRLKKEYNRMKEKIKARGAPGIIPENPTSFRTQAAREIQTGEASITTNMLAENLPPFNLE